jgi:chorismate mutase
MVAHPSAEPTLASVRRDLEEIDRGIVLLVAARVDAACTAIRLRSGKEGRIADPSQEHRVISRAQAWAQEVGLSPALTETIFRAMIEQGKERFGARAPPAGSVDHLRTAGHVRARVVST